MSGLVKSFHNERAADQMTELFADTLICTLEAAFTIQRTSQVNFV